MNTPWMEMSLRDFQAALASSSPTPGGGTAAAVALGQSAALTLMVCDLTLGKDKWQDGWDVANRAVSIAVKTMNRAGELADEDSAAFDAVMDAFKLPKESDDDKEIRRHVIRSATLKAAEVPYETAELGLGLLEILPELAEKGNSNAASDVGVAGLLASAACKGALFNVDINLDSIPAEMGSDLRKKADEVLEESRSLSRAVMDSVRDRI